MKKKGNLCSQIWNHMNRKYLKKNWRSIAAVTVFLLVWELATRSGYANKLFVSMPSDIFSAGWELIASGKITPHILVSLQTLASGFALAVIAGTVSGIVVGHFPKVYDFLRPFLYAGSALPVVIMIPLVILWFGIGIGAKIFVVFFMALVPILINTIDGARRTEKNFLSMAKSFGANDYFILKKVVFFSTLPYILTGIRSAIGRSIVGLVISEAFGNGKGIGFLIVLYGGVFQTSRLMALILMLVAFSLTITTLFGVIEKKIIIKNR